MLDTGGLYTGGCTMSLHTISELPYIELIGLCKQQANTIADMQLTLDALNMYSDNQQSTIDRLLYESTVSANVIRRLNNQLILYKAYQRDH